MPTYERALTAREQREFNQYAAIGNLMIGGERDSPPTRIVTAIHAYIDRHRRKHAGPSESRREGEEKPGNAQAARALATVWGDQFIRVFGWEWICVMFDGEEHYVVVQPDRSLVIFAAEYIEACLDMETMDCAVKSAFDQLRANAIPPQEMLSYTSAMRWVDPGLDEPGTPMVPAHAMHRAADRFAAFIRTCSALTVPNEWTHQEPTGTSRVQIPLA